MSTAMAEQAPENVDQPTRRPLKKAFISYASSDRRFAARLAHDLRTRGVKVWMDETGIEGGEDWRQKIVDALQASEDVLLVVSPAARESKYVAQELGLADQLNKPVTPLLRRKCRPWLGVSHLHYIDFTEWYDEGLAKLMQPPVPPRTPLRHFLIFLKRLRVILPALAIALAVAAGIYFGSPSATSFTFASSPESGILLVRVSNTGGRSSLLLANESVLDFGTLPIEPRRLELLDSEKVSRIPGHSEHMIRLTTSRPLTPRKRNEMSYSSLEEVLPLLPNATARLRTRVRESGDRSRQSDVVFPATDIRNFIMRTYPQDVRVSPY